MRKAVATKLPLPSNRECEETRAFLKGVRLNRRFLLLMEFKSKKSSS
jgi:hypothetical protein